MLNDTLHKEEKESLTANLELENKLEQTRTEYEKKLNNLKKELNEMRQMNIVITILIHMSCVYLLNFLGIWVLVKVVIN